MVTPIGIVGLHDKCMSVGSQSNSVITDGNYAWRSTLGTDRNRSRSYIGRYYLILSRGRANLHHFKFAIHVLHSH